MFSVGDKIQMLDDEDGLYWDCVILNVENSGELRLHFPKLGKQYDGIYPIEKARATPEERLLTRGTTRSTFKSIKKGDKITYKEDTIVKDATVAINDFKLGMFTIDNGNLVAYESVLKTAPILVSEIQKEMNESKEPKTTEPKLSKKGKIIDLNATEKSIVKKAPPPVKLKVKQEEKKKTPQKRSRLQVSTPQSGSSVSSESEAEDDIKRKPPSYSAEDQFKTINLRLDKFDVKLDQQIKILTQMSDTMSQTSSSMELIAKSLQRMEEKMSSRSESSRSESVQSLRGITQEELPKENHSTNPKETSEDLLRVGRHLNYMYTLEKILENSPNKTFQQNNESNVYSSLLDVLQSIDSSLREAVTIERERLLTVGPAVENYARTTLLSMFQALRTHLKSSAPVISSSEHVPTSSEKQAHCKTDSIPELTKRKMDIPITEPLKKPNLNNQDNILPLNRNNSSEKVPKTLLPVLPSPHVGKDDLSKEKYPSASSHLQTPTSITVNLDPDDFKSALSSSNSREDLAAKLFLLYFKVPEIASQKLSVKSSLDPNKLNEIKNVLFNIYPVLEEGKIAEKLWKNIYFKVVKTSIEKLKALNNGR